MSRCVRPGLSSVLLLGLVMVALAALAARRLVSSLCCRLWPGQSLSVFCVSCLCPSQVPQTLTSMCPLVSICPFALSAWTRPPCKHSLPLQGHLTVASWSPPPLSTLGRQPKQTSWHTEEEDGLERVDKLLLLRMKTRNVCTMYVKRAFFQLLMCLAKS